MKTKSLALIAVLAALGVLAVLAASAFGKATSVLPGTSKTEWTGVNCTLVSGGSPCSATPFHVVSTASILRHNGEKVAKCEVTLAGDINANGTTEVTSGSVSGLGVCGSITLNFKKKWPDEICQWHKGKKEPQMWDRLEVHFNVESAGVELNGPIYIHLETTAGADGDPLVIGRAVAPNSEIGDESATLNKGWTIVADGTTESSTPYVFTVSEAFPQLEVESNEKAACGWPELT
jgi:hypothetical protein